MYSILGVFLRHGLRERSKPGLRRIECAIVWPTTKGCTGAGEENRRLGQAETLRKLLLIDGCPGRKRAAQDVLSNLFEYGGTEELSKSTDMTPHYFCRTFRQSIGMPPHRDLISRRIERSKELLASTDKDVTEIALEVGFSSHAHFSAAFQRAVGYAPRTYRNSVRHGALR
jgi:AraC-like DNA-binding protein